MLLVDFDNLLKRKMGLDAASIGAAAIERAVQSRLAACEIADASAYWEHLRTSEVELQELIEAVIVPETWFFRDKEAFAALGRSIQMEWRQANPSGVQRLLSLPCSTGEEPYSMAMTLLDAGLAADDFRIDAVDISLRAITRARHGVYGKNSFRGSDLGYRGRYFEAVGPRYHLAKSVRAQVTFHHGNLLDDHLLPGAEIYDVIFCRNVLIYFDRTTQDHVITVLSRLLTARGSILVGSSETGLLLSHGFVPAKLPLAFAFRKAGTVPREPKPKAESRSAPAASPRRTIRRPFSTAIAVPPPKPVAAPPVPLANLLHEAAQFADQGRFAEASASCEQHLRAHGPSAAAFYLLALVRDATGRPSDAISLYRKALYLDANHYEALVHLACVLEQQGDVSGATVLKARARRLAPTDRK